MRYARAVSKKATSQRQPIPGSSQEQNNAGGFAWTIDGWARLDRFLVLGSEGGTYYVGERELTRQNATTVERCIAADGARTVRRIVEFSESGRAPKNAPAIFALALAASDGDDATRKLAFEALPKVARTGTHLFEFAEAVEHLRGWGRGARRAVARWYADRHPRDLAYQVTKYQQRGGWSHRDLLRLAHPKANGALQEIFHWLVKGWPGVGDEPHPDEALRVIWAFEKAKRAANAEEVARLIRDERLTREMVPTTFLTSPLVWEALLEEMPFTAMIRNLATMSKVGLLVPGSEAERTVISRLADADRLRRARVHPIAVLSALRTYAGGHGVRSKAQWEPCPAVVDALDAAFYASFRMVEPTGKRTLLALDVSGSMTVGEIAGVPGLSPRVASAALALVTANVESSWDVVGFTAANFPSSWVHRSTERFSTGIARLRISPRQRIDDVVNHVSGLPFGATDCALPMLWALKEKLPVDTVVIYTDNETWAGDVHPAQALQRYRDEMGIPTKLVVVGMTATQFSIADPNDAGMLDVVGFDTATPQLIADFARGNL